MRACLLLLLLTVAGTAGCGEPSSVVAPVPPMGVAIRTQDGWPVSVLRPSSGPGRLVLVAPNEGEREPEVLVARLMARGQPVVSYDGARIVFSGRTSEDEPWRIWSCDARGRDLRLEVDAIEDLAWPALLSDGRIAYAAVMSRPGPLVQWGAAWALHVSPGSGAAGRRITFGAGLEAGPVVLRDGRLLYGCWQPGGEHSEEGVYSYTVHPDGTGARRMPGPDGARWHGGWRQLPDGRILVVADGVTYVREEGGGAWRRIDGEAAGSGDAPVPLAPHEPPQGHLSVVDEERHHGDLLAIDARHAKGAGTRVRLRALTGTFAANARPQGEILGFAELRPDGSFFARVPADTPLLLDLLDATGEVLVQGETPFWVRPNETRACVGCHEDPRTAPPNRRPDAVRQEPVRLLGREGSR